MVKFKVEDVNFNKIYPVGSIYMSVNSTSPATLFGGTWERIKDTFLLACGDTYDGGSTGGEATHKLTVNEMPSHTHIQNSHNHTQNRHRHEMRGSKTTGMSSGTYLRAGAGSEKDSEYTDYTTPTNNAATATNQNTGGSQAHNNMPPYLAVFVWVRIS